METLVILGNTDHALQVTEFKPSNSTEENAVVFSSFGIDPWEEFRYTVSAALFS